MRHVLLALAVSALASSCEHKVDEPTPPPRPDKPAATVAIPTASALPEASIEPPHPPASSDAAASRCIFKTPATPERPLVKGPAPGCPKDDEANPAKLRTGHITFKGAKNQEITVEIAEKDHDRQRGLMFRKQMADDHGMIFTFPLRDDHTFWMHNTCIPLDMLFIDEDGLIVGIQENTPTLSDDTFHVGCKSSYVLEMNAGWCRAHGVVAGQVVKLSI